MKRQNLKKQVRNQCFSLLPTFVPLNKYDAYSVNKTTDVNLLHDLIRLAQRTKYFTIVTESDLYTHKPSLIQIEIIHQELSIVLVFEVCHLPQKDKDSLAFWLIRSIFQFILQSTKIIYLWGDAIEKLSPFKIYSLFKNENLYEPMFVNLQEEFNQWYSGRIYREGALKKNWSLQCAIASTYNQFLDKSERLNIWSRGLYRQNHGIYSEKIESMIKYAINDCLAITKLASTLGQDIGWM